MKRSGIVCATLVVASLLAPAAFAGAEKGDWVLRFGAQIVDPSGEYDTRETYSEDSVLLPDFSLGTVESEQSIRFSGESGIGYFASLEYRWTDLVGIEVAVSEESADLSGFVRLEQSGVNTLGVRVFEDGSTRVFDGSVDVRPVSLGLNVHHDFGFMELTLGALASYTLFDGFTLNGVDYEIDDDFGWGWQVGLDFPLGESKWFVAFSVRYIKVTADVKVNNFPVFEEDLLQDEFEQEGFSDTTYNHDPYVVRLGAGYRF
jgi:outer membrane protein W